MREMVLNHASLASPDEHTCLRWLQDLAVGISTLTRQGVATSSLRMYQPSAELECMPGYSLDKAMLALRQTARDESLFLLRLSTKTPLLTSVGGATRDRFLRSEAITLSSTDGEPLLLCAIQGWIAISFPSAPDWEGHRLSVMFEELLPDEEYEQAQETIDNLSCSAHAEPICERHRARSLQGLTLREQWNQRKTVFPFLQFGAGVHSNIREQETNLTTILHRLHDLNDAIASWQSGRATIPAWQSKVSPESARVLADPHLRATRMFPSSRGTTELFDWHARYGGSGRIHFRLELQSRTIEIGYIGPHLPL